MTSLNIPDSPFLYRRRAEWIESMSMKEIDDFEDCEINLLNTWGSKMSTTKLTTTVKSCLDAIDRNIDTAASAPYSTTC